MRRIFISYSSLDRPFAIKLQRRLQSHGARVWIDILEIRAGETIIRSLSQAISSSNYFIIILSPESVKSRWVTHELEQALTRQIAHGTRFVIPVLYQECAIPQYLRQFKYIDLSGTTNLDNEFRSLLESLGLIDPKYHSSLREPKQTLVKDFLSRLKERGDESYNDLLAMPGVDELFLAVRFQMFGGQLAERIVTLFSYFSNIPDHAQNWFGLITAMIFDIMEIGKPPPRDAIIFISKLVSCQYINVVFRSWVANLLIDILKEVDDNKFVISTVPKIFPRYCHEPLADMATSEFLGAPLFNSDSLLEKFWSITPASERARIANYVRRTTVWSEPRIEVAPYESSDSLQDVWQAWKEQFRNTWVEGELDEENNRPIDQVLRRELKKKTVNMEKVVAAIETYVTCSSASTRSRVSTAAKLNRVTIPRILKKFGDAWRAHLVSNLVCSSYIPLEMGSGLLVANADIAKHIFLMDDRFPNALLSPKVTIWSSKNSFISEWCQSAVNNQDSLAYLLAIIILNVIELFDDDVVKLAIHQELIVKKPANEISKTLLGVIRGKIQAEKASETFSGRIQQKENT